MRHAAFSFQAYEMVLRNVRILPLFGAILQVYLSSLQCTQIATKKRGEERGVNKVSKEEGPYMKSAIKCKA